MESLVSGGNPLTQGRPSQPSLTSWTLQPGLAAHKQPAPSLLGQGALFLRRLTRAFSQLLPGHVHSSAFILSASTTYPAGLGARRLKGFWGRWHKFPSV